MLYNSLNKGKNKKSRKCAKISILTSEKCILQTVPTSQNLASEYLHLVFILSGVFTFSSTKYFLTLSIGAAVVRQRRAMHSCTFHIWLFVFQRKVQEEPFRCAKIVRIFSSCCADARSGPDLQRFTCDGI